MLNPVMCFYTRKEREAFGHRHTEREADVNGEEGIGVVSLQAKGRQGMLATAEARNVFQPC